MASYKVLSIVQSVFIILCAISLLDYGYSLQHLVPAMDLGFNKILFDTSSDFWNVIAFWAYCAFAVGILQLIKGLTVNTK